MKKATLALFSTALLLATAPAIAQQDGPAKNEHKRYKHVKETSISKTYSASGNQLWIENSFGDVKFIAASGNEIKVNVHIEASSDNEAAAQKVFDAMKVEHKQDGNRIVFKSSINSKNDKKNECKNCNTSMRIDYEVQLPVSVPLTVDNSFGNITIPDYKGTVSVTSKFGNLNAGDLQDVKKLEVMFGDAEVSNLSNVSASVKFANFTVKNISGKNKIDLEFCGRTQIGLSSAIESLELKESYSTVNLRPASNLSATYSIKTNFGSVKDRANIGISRTDKPEKYGPDARQEHEGKSGSGSAKITVRSEFGTIIVGEASAADFESDTKNNNNKSKNKNKNKSTTQTRNGQSSHSDADAKGRVVI